MPDTFSSIREMTTAVKKAQDAVGDHLRRAIERELNQLTAHGFDYNEALDIVTQHTLFMQFLMTGKMKAENKVDLMLVSLGKNEEFAD